MFASVGSRGQRGRAGRGDFRKDDKLFFPQATVPVGWVLDTTHNDKAIRIVNTVGGGASGSSPFSTVFGKTATDAKTLATAEIPAHNHPNTIGDTNLLGAPGAGAVLNTSGTQGYSLIGTPVSSNTGGGGSHTHGMDIRVQYVDCIIGKKV